MSVAPDGSPVPVSLRLPAMGEPELEMLAHVDGATTVHACVESLELGRTFDCVLFGSHFVNDPSPEGRHALHSACARHAAAGGAVLVETYSPDAEWVPGHERTIDGVTLRLVHAERSGSHLRATMEYEVDGDVWRQPFEAMLLSEDELREDAARAGLRFERWLDERRSWFLLHPAR